MNESPLASCHLSPFSFSSEGISKPSSEKAEATDNLLFSCCCRSRSRSRLPPLASSSRDIIVVSWASDSEVRSGEATLALRFSPVFTTSLSVSGQSSFPRSKLHCKSSSWNWELAPILAPSLRTPCRSTSRRPSSSTSSSATGSKPNSGAFVSEVLVSEKGPWGLPSFRYAALLELRIRKSSECGSSWIKTEAFGTAAFAPLEDASE
mmetsp:Transcript_49646/g.89234  ORF Transcript_49646/g.89234 Transcript_49646/m.89234 type:complete len:207 (+) Transcript_49646:86-706(+)